MEENHHVLRPLLLPSTSSATNNATTPPLDHQELDSLKIISSNSSIILRLSLVFFIGIVSIWATNEASKGFRISVVNECRNTIPGKRFELLYSSNDEATRIVIKASKIVENFLYHHDANHTKKLVNHIILRYAEPNITDNFIVTSSNDHEFVLNISSSIMESTNFGHAMSLTVQKGVTRIWLWDGQGNAPTNLVNGIVEYITRNLGDPIAASIFDRVEPPRPTASCCKHGGSRAMAEFLGYCEQLRPGFIRRLNQAMKDEWHDDNLDIALGMPVQNLCTTYKSLRYNISSTSSFRFLLTDWVSGNIN